MTESEFRSKTVNPMSRLHLDHMRDDDENQASLLDEILLSPDLDTGHERIDTKEGLIELEQDKVALDFLREQYNLPELTEREKALAPVLTSVHAVERIGNQFGNKLLQAYKNPDPDEALHAFRAIEPHTVDEEMALLISDNEFLRLRHMMLATLGEQQETIVSDVEKRLDPKSGQIARNDRYQFNGNETKRSLSELLRNGIPVEVMEDAVSFIQEKYAQGERLQVPLTELLKNERILIANGFPDSKVSVAIHDIMDHAWGFYLMRYTGLDVKFKDLFDSIGNPALTDIYKREGEIPASICFGVRYWASQERGFTPIINASDLRCMMEHYFDDNELADRHMEAFRILRNMSPETHEWQSLSFAYSNYVTELDEQRRKHGKIKQRDVNTHEVIGELATDSPEFIAFFVEMHHLLMDSKHKHRDELFRVHLLFEEYLQAVGSGKIDHTRPFVIKVDQISEYNYSRSELSPGIIRWMFRNYGFSATKDTLA
jgi:hypothetical protein